MSYRIRVALVMSTLGGGGAERVVAHLCRSFDPEQFDVHVVVLKQLGEQAIELREQGYSVYCLARGDKVDYFTSLRLMGLVRSIGIDVLHSHDIHGLLDCSIVRRLRPRVRHVHTFHFGNYPHLPRKYLRLESVCCRLADRLVAVGEAQRQAILRTHGFPVARVQRIWNGVEAVPQRQPDPLDDRLPEGKLIIGSISTLIEQKGVPYLLEAVRLLRGKRQDFHLLIAGEGPLRDSLEAQVAELSLQDSVTFLGWLDNAARRLLTRIDIFVQSSLWEAMSIVVLESMAAGVPAVVTDVGENAQVLTAGENGLVVPSADSQALADALERLLGDSVLRRGLGQAAHQTYSARFKTDYMARAHETLYLEMFMAGETGRSDNSVPCQGKTPKGKG